MRKLNKNLKAFGEYRLYPSAFLIQKSEENKMDDKNEGICKDCLWFEGKYIEETQFCDEHGIYVKGYEKCSMFKNKNIMEDDFK